MEPKKLRIPDIRSRNLALLDEFIKTSRTESESFAEGEALEAGLDPAELSTFRRVVERNPETLREPLERLATAKAGLSRAKTEGAQALLDQAIRNNLFRGFGAAFSDMSVGTSRVRELLAEEDAARANLLQQEPVNEAEAQVQEAAGAAEVEKLQEEIDFANRQASEQTRQANAANMERLEKEKQAALESHESRLFERQKDTAEMAAKDKQATASIMNAQANMIRAQKSGSAKFQEMKELRRPTNAVIALQQADDELGLIETEMEKFRGSQNDPALKAALEAAGSNQSVQEFKNERMQELEEQKRDAQRVKSRALGNLRAGTLDPSTDVTDLRIAFRILVEQGYTDEAQKVRQQLLQYSKQQ